MSRRSRPHPPIKVNNCRLRAPRRDGGGHEPSKVRYAIIAQPKSLATVFTRPRPKAAEVTQAVTFGAEKRRMLPPRPHADLDPCADREGILLNCAQGRSRTHPTFKPADGALRGPHLSGHFPLRHAPGSNSRLVSKNANSHERTCLSSVQMNLSPTKADRGREYRPFRTRI